MSLSDWEKEGLSFDMYDQTESQKEKTEPHRGPNRFQQACQPESAAMSHHLKIDKQIYAAFLTPYEKLEISHFKESLRSITF